MSRPASSGPDPQAAAAADHDRIRAYMTGYDAGAVNRLTEADNPHHPRRQAVEWRSWRRGFRRAKGIGLRVHWRQLGDGLSVLERGDAGDYADRS